MAEEIKLDSDNHKEEKPDITFEMHYVKNMTKGKSELRSNVKDMELGIGMLELAKDMFKAQIASMNQSKIVPPQGGMLNFARNFKRR